MDNKTPYGIWKSNKWRVDMRQYTRKFQQKFKERKRVTMETGKVYAVKYTVDNVCPTDKHHFTPLILSFGRFLDENNVVNVRAVNLFYLDTTNVLRILQDTHKYMGKKLQGRILPMVNVHDRYMEIFPWAFKNFLEHRICSSMEVDVDEWGMIPLLKKELMGNFNPCALMEDFKKEKKVVPTIQKQTNKKQENVDEDTKENIIEEDMINIEMDEQEEMDI